MKNTRRQDLLEVLEARSKQLPSAADTWLPGPQMESLEVSPLEFSTAGIRRAEHPKETLLAKGCDPSLELGNELG